MKKILIKKNYGVRGTLESNIDFEYQEPESLRDSECGFRIWKNLW